MYSNEAIISFLDKHTVTLLSDYIYYLIQGNRWEDGTNKAVMGLTLNKASLSKVRVNIHEVSDQRKIVETLDYVSETINHRKNQLEKLDNLIKARFVEMFGDISEHKALSELTTKITDGSHLPPKGIEKSEYKMLSSQNVYDELVLDDVRYLTKKDFEKENKRTDIQNGDVLLTIVGTIGRTYVVKNDEKYVFQRSVGVIKPKANVLNGIFLATYLKTPEAENQLETGGHGSSQKGIYLQDLKKLPIPVVEYSKQIIFEKYVKQINKSKVVDLNHIAY